jgi:hypothetical protein
MSEVPDMTESEVPKADIIDLSDWRRDGFRKRALGVEEAIRAHAREIAAARRSSVHLRVVEADPE